MVTIGLVTMVIIGMVTMVTIGMVTMVTIGMVTFMCIYISQTEQSMKIKLTMLSPYNGARMTQPHTQTQHHAQVSAHASEDTQNDQILLLRS